MLSLIKFKLLCFLFLCCLFSTSVFSATIENAYEHYIGKNYEQALTDFKVLASLGNKDAQYLLGAMYANGHGVKKDKVEAYAWMSLASSKGNPDAINGIDTLSKMMNKSEISSANKRILVLQQDFGDEALSELFYPTFTEQVSREFKERRPLRKAMAKYPKKMARKGISGGVIIEYVVSRDGRTRFHEVLTFTSEGFIEESLKATKSFFYKPAEFNGRPIDTYLVRNKFTYDMGYQVQRDGLVEQLEELRSRAKVGTSMDRYQYSMITGSVKHFIPDEAKYRFNDTGKWTLAAAVDGLADAQIDLAKDMLYANQCEVEPNKSRFWLDRAIEGGSLKAQLLLGLEVYYGYQFERDPELGLSLIHKAAAGGYDHAKVYFAWLTAISKDKKRLGKAIEIFDQVDYKKFHDKLTYHEVAAALYGADKDFKNAVKHQKKAINLAKEFNVDDSLLLMNMDKLKSKQPLDRLI